MTDQHKFRGVRQEPEGWIGACSCSHETEPGTKDEAWKRITAHFLTDPQIRAAIFATNPEE